MKRNILLAFTILLVNSAFVRTYGQNSVSDPLKKEVVEQSRSSGQEWENDRKRTYQYDLLGREILNRLSLWDDEVMSWYISNDEITEYDQDNNRTSIHLINYLEYPEKFNDRKEIRKYENGLVKYRQITLQDYNSSEILSSGIYDVFYEYNENGDRTEFTVHYSENEEFRGGYGFRWYFNENYCETAFVDYNIDAGSNEIVSDSTSNTLDSRCNITQESRYDFSSGYFDLYSDKKYEYEYDENGNIHKQTEYLRSKSYEDWQEITTSVFTYSDSDLIESIHRLSSLTGREILQSSIFDFQDRLIQQLVEIKENPETVWMPNSSSQWQYNDIDQLEKVESYSDWNPIANDYINIHIIETFFDSEGNSIKTISNRNLSGEITRKEENREYRCDGVITVETLKTRYYVNGSIVQTEDATYTSYFNLAPCKPPSDLSSEFIIYPNPTNDYFRIYNDKLFGKSHLRIMKSNGELVKELEEIVDNYFSVDVSTLEPGLYLIQIENEAGSSSQQFIKK